MLQGYRNILSKYEINFLSINNIDIKGSSQKALILFKYFHNTLSVPAGEYIKIAVLNSTYSFHLSSLLCVCVRACAATKLFLRSYCRFEAVDGVGVNGLLS
jgi:hypothetical protein